MQAQRLQSQSLNVTRFCGCRRCSRSQVLQLRDLSGASTFKRCGDGGLLIALTRQPAGEASGSCGKAAQVLLETADILFKMSAHLQQRQRNAGKVQTGGLQISILVIVPVKPAEF